MSTPPLAIWISGAKVATLTAAGRSTTRRLTLTYEPHLRAGEPVLSVGLPVSARPITGPRVHAYFNGLLPEGEARAMLAYDFGRIDPADVMAMLAALGRDCAGALVIVPDGERVAPAGRGLAIDDAAISQRLARLHIEPLGADARIRVSLAGVQAKLLLAGDETGWKLPVDGAPSTHILKPAMRQFRDSVAIEAFSLEFARRLGVVTTQSRIGNFDGRQALVVERYDRELTTDGVTRIHQEDFCQAFGIEPAQKYEQQGGPSLAQCAGLLREVARPADVLGLLDAAVVTVLLGNADAHGKNLSLLHRGRDIALAPLYDLLITFHDGEIDSTMGMTIGGEVDVMRVQLSHVRDEARAWGLPSAQVDARVAELCTRVPDALAEATRTVALPDEVAAALDGRIRQLL